MTTSGESDERDDRMEATALLVVDVQPDFLPGGALPVEGGDEIVEPIAGLMRARRFPLLVATQDWHPPDHVSFASNHPDKEPGDTIDLDGHEQRLWPDHCVQGTQGARLHPDLPLETLHAIIRKGTDPQSDSYSGFRNNWTPGGERPSTGLAGFLRDRGVRHVAVCGLARDVCVKWTAEDAIREGFDATVVWNLTRGVDPDADARVRRDLEGAGVRIVESPRL